MAVPMNAGVMDKLSGDDGKSLVTFQVSMQARVEAAGPGTAERPFDHKHWFIEVEKPLKGTTHNLDVSKRAEILAMKRSYPEVQAEAAILYQQSRAPTYDAEGNMLTVGVPKR